MLTQTSATSWQTVFISILCDCIECICKCGPFIRDTAAAATAASFIGIWEYVCAYCVAFVCVFVCTRETSSIPSERGCSNVGQSKICIYQRMRQILSFYFTVRRALLLLLQFESAQNHICLFSEYISFIYSSIWKNARCYGDGGSGGGGGDINDQISTEYVLQEQSVCKWWYTRETSKTVQNQITRTQNAN